MHESYYKLRRQIEILGFVVSNPGFYSIQYFMEYYDVDMLTIKRDLNSLRKDGIDIHSVRGKGIVISNKINNSKIESLLQLYIGLAVYNNSFDRATRIFVKKRNENGLSIMVKLQSAIENKKVIRILYYKTDYKDFSEFEINPQLIYQSEKSWRLLAVHDNVIKQYLLTHIKQVEILNKKFKPIPKNEIENLFNTSFRSWLGKGNIKVRLHLFDPWNNYIKKNSLMECETITEQPDGSIIYETTVNSLSEIAGWIVSRGKGVIVLEPNELKQNVISIAESALNNYC